MEHKTFEKILQERDAEIEQLKQHQQEYDVIRSDEYKHAKRVLGNLWDESFRNLSIPVLHKLCHDYGRTG